MAKFDIKLTDQKDPPTPKFVEIVLSEFSRNDGLSLLSPRLKTDKEIDKQIDFLKDQLEKLRGKAKKQLAK